MRCTTNGAPAIRAPSPERKTFLNVVRMTASGRSRRSRAARRDRVRQHGVAADALHAGGDAVGCGARRVVGVAKEHQHAVAAALQPRQQQHRADLPPPNALELLWARMNISA